jgi:hypothetical protein
MSNINSESSASTASLDPDPEPDDGRGDALRAPTQIRLALLGALFWFLAAQMVRVGTPLGLFDGRALALTYLAALPLSWGFLQIGRAVGQLTPRTIVRGVALMVATATLLDGLALALLPTLYGTSTPHILAGAAWILWGVGVGTAMALMVQHRDR